MIEFMRGAIVVTCIMLVCAYVCRVNLMTWKTARWDVLTFHLAMLIYCGWSGIEAATRTPLTTNRIGLIAATLWLVISWPTWRHGLPSHARKLSSWPEIEKT